MTSSSKCQNGSAMSWLPRMRRGEPNSRANAEAKSKTRFRISLQNADVCDF